jgi:protein disulfide-isomerase A6
VGAVDVPDNSATGQDYGVSGYPTIKFFGSDKTKPSDFSSSDRTFEKFVNFSLGKAKA